MIESLLNYIGHKSKIVDQILTHLPTQVNGSFYDMFAGSCVVALNAPYNKIQCVEKNEHLSNLYGHLTDPNFHAELTLFLTTYNLTNSSVVPRSQYLKNPNIGTVQWMGKTIPNLHLDKLNEPGYKQVITDFNNNKFTGIHRSIAYMVATIYGRNSSVNTRPDGTLSGGVGPLDFSLKCNKKFNDHLTVLKQNRHSFVCDSYENIKPTSDDFCYFDPPYLATSFHYQGWDEVEEKKLLDYIDKLPCDWALSNTFQSGTKVNSILKEWAQDKTVIYINKKYRKWAGTNGAELTKRSSKVNEEVLILSKPFNTTTVFGNGLFEQEKSSLPTKGINTIDIERQ
jgi:site-specific DNA-adenine methylase